MKYTIIQIALTPDQRAKVNSKKARAMIASAPDAPDAPARKRTAALRVRVTDEQKARFNRLGGAEWFRSQLRGQA